jgi:PAS domain S-box-containing protein
MKEVRPLRAESPVRPASRGDWCAVLMVASAVGAVLLLLLFQSRIQHLDPSWWLLAAVAAALGGVGFLHTRFLIFARADHRESDHRFQQLADNIEEVFWMIDAETKQILYINQACERITRRPWASLRGAPNSWLDLLHPLDRAWVSAKLSAATSTGQFDEKFRIVWPNRETRWVWVRAWPVRSWRSDVVRLVGTAQDITAQREAEDRTAKSLVLTEAARAEADALHRATLALTQDLRMDYLLDRVLDCLGDLIPCESASVFLLEADTHFFIAREMPRFESNDLEEEKLLTIDTHDVPLLEEMVAGQKGVLLEDTANDPRWRPFAGHAADRSWLGVPLLASRQVVGFMALAHRHPSRFTEDHLRRAELLAIPAAVAIQNARLYERAEIYEEELLKQVTGYRGNSDVLAGVDGRRRMGEDTFQEIFRSSPLPSSITTMEGGRFLQANRAFVERYGYSYDELVGNTVCEPDLWESSLDRMRIARELQKGRPIHNYITRFRSKSGEMKLTIYSAIQVRLDGIWCILATSGEPLPYVSKETN